MITIDSPSSTSSENPCSTSLGPNDLWTSTSLITSARRGKRKRNVMPPFRACQWGKRNGAGRGRPRPVVRLADRLRREASERATHVAFTQALEGPVAELAHALARDTQHRADFLE